MKKRYSGFLLTLTLMFAVILGFIPGVETALTVHAEEELETSETEGVTASGTCGENLTWTLENGTLTISGTGEMESYTFFPSTPWSKYKDSIKTLNIDEGVVSIADFAFGELSCITSVSIPKSVTSIGRQTFQFCTNLSSVTFDGDVPYIDEYAFAACDSLDAVYVDSMEAWLNGSFKGSFSNPLTNGAELYINGVALGSTLVIPDGIEVLPHHAFEGCKFTKVIIAESVTEIGYRCFSGCTNLTEIKFSDSVTEIGQECFSNCLSIETITFPASLEGIGDQVFLNSSSLKTVFFKGNAPYMQEYWWGSGHYSESSGGSFIGCTFTAYYPNNDTWTKEVLETNYGGKITWIGYESTLATPSKPYKIANVVNGVHVYWNAVDGATKYGLWRSETGADGTYKWIGNPTTNHFTDTKVTTGKTYYYCVTACNLKTNVHTLKSEPLGITYVGTPDITDRMNLAAGVKLSWNKISGATGYAIYRKPYTGNVAWVRVTTISGNETFTWTDKSVASANGTIYRYTIRALAGTNMKTLSGCRNTGRTMARLTSRTMNSVTKTAATSVKCTWTTTVQASGYEVRFMNGSTVVKQFTVGNYKTGAKTFTGIPTGANYKVQVRSYKKVDGVGAFYSAWSTPKYVNL